MVFPLVTLLLLLFLSPSSAEIRFTEIRSNGHLITFLHEFGFTDSGRLELNISSLSLSNPKADLSKLAFFLIPHDSFPHLVQYSETACPLDFNLLRNIFSFNSNILDSNSTIISHPGAGHFALGFANCSPGLRVSMNVLSSTYNLQFDTGRRNYLSAGITPLPRVYTFFSLVYFAIVVLWMSILFEKRWIVSGNHILVFSVLILKALNLLSDAEGKQFINTTGRPHFHSFDAQFYISLCLKILMNMFPHLASPSFSSVAIDKTVPNSVPWELVFLLAEAIFFCAVMFATVWWNNRFRATAKTSKEAAKKLMKLKVFRNYSAVVFCYIYFTSVVVYALRKIASYRYMWTSAAVAEFITLTFYVFAGYYFARSS